MGPVWERAPNLSGKGEGSPKVAVFTKLDSGPAGVALLSETTSWKRRTAQGGNVQILSTGQQIKHQQYGLGIVTESDAERTAIDFHDHGRKLFVTSIMTAELIGDAPVNPVRAKRRSRKPTRRS
jgi:hypothetical protein